MEKINVVEENKFRRFGGMIKVSVINICSNDRIRNMVPQKNEGKKGGRKKAQTRSMPPPRRPGIKNCKKVKEKKEEDCKKT